MNITTLLFDIGDVLIDIDWQRGYKKLLGHMKHSNGQDLTLEEITEKLHPGPYGSIWDDFGINKLSRAEFLAIVSEKTAYKGDANKLEEALTVLFEALPERVSLLNKLINNTPLNVALISDTNEMHMTHIENHVPGIFKNIPKEKRFYSYNLGLKKKNGKEIYESVLNTLNINPENALMIDDRIDNKIGADQIGLNFLLIQKDESLETALKSAPYNLTF